MMSLDTVDCNPLRSSSTSTVARVLSDCTNHPGIDQERSDTADPPVLGRHPHFWFFDGSVILRAENVIFRVHMSILSRRSALFKDMFALPQPDSQIIPSPKELGNNLEVMEGCPIIVLHDSAEDLSNLLKALYDSPDFGNNDRDDFRVVSGILRLSAKYLIDVLRDKALAHLSTAWPRTLKAWDAREEIARTYESDTLMPRGFRYPSPVAVINLAREVNAPELLWSAFYDLSRYHFTQIYEPGADEPLSSSPRGCTLSSFDMEKLALGKEVSQQAVVNLIQSMPSAAHRDSVLDPTLSSIAHHRRRSSGVICTSAAACRKDFSELVDLATQHYLLDRERGCTDPLYVAEELGQLKSAEFSECKACARSLETWAAKERERIWKMIPTWFRLDS